MMEDPVPKLIGVSASSFPSRNTRHFHTSLIVGSAPPALVAEKLLREHDVNQP